jgi:hypothetical protein
MEQWDQLNLSAILNKFHTEGISTRLYESPGWLIWKRNELWIDFYKKVLAGQILTMLKWLRICEYINRVLNSKLQHCIVL